MKKLGIVLSLLVVGQIFLIQFKQKVFANLISPDDWLYRSTINPDGDKPSTLFEFVEPIHLIIGSIVLFIVAVSLFMLFKSKKK